MFGGRGTYIYYVLVEEGKYDGVTWEVGWSRQQIKHLRWYLRRMTNRNIFPFFLRVFPESSKPCQTSSSANEPIFKQLPQTAPFECPCDIFHDVFPTERPRKLFFFWIIQVSPNKLGFPKWHFQGLQSPQVVVNGQRDCRLSSWGELTSLEDLRAVLTSKCQEAKEKLPLGLRSEIGRLTPSHHSEGCRWLIESCDIHKKVQEHVVWHLPFSWWLYKCFSCWNAVSICLFIVQSIQVGIHLSQAKQELKGQRVGVCWIDWATGQCRCDQTAGWCHTYIWLIFMVFICQSHIVCFGSLSFSLVKGNNKLMSCTMWLLQHMRPQPMRLKWKSSMQALLHDMNYFILAFSSVWKEIQHGPIPSYYFLCSLRTHQKSQEMDHVMGRWFLATSVFLFSW